MVSTYDEITAHFRKFIRLTDVGGPNDDPDENAKYRRWLDWVSVPQTGLDPFPQNERVKP